MSILTQVTANTRKFNKIPGLLPGSGHHIPVLDGVIGVKFFTPFCSQAISRKSRQSISVYSVRCRNGVEKIGLG